MISYLKRKMVELGGLEPPTSSLAKRRVPSLRNAVNHPLTPTERPVCGSDDPPYRLGTPLRLMFLVPVDWLTALVSDTTMHLTESGTLAGPRRIDMWNSVYSLCHARM